MKLFSLATVVAVLAFSTSTASADIILSVTEVGSDLHFSFSGTIDLTGDFGEHFINENLDLMTGNRVTSQSSAAYRDITAGVVTNYPFGAGYQLNPSNGSGEAFGFNNNGIYWDATYGQNPGELTIDRSWTVANRTIAGQFNGADLSSPVVLWTHTGSGDTISLLAATVPEPSSAAAIGLLSVCFAARRRRRRGA